MNIRSLPTWTLIAGILASFLALTAGAPAAPQNSSPFAAQVAQLHAIHGLLQQAKHDYKGHRARAVKHISQAIHELHPVAHKNHHPQQMHARGAVKAVHEAQPVSDGQLQKALVALVQVQSQLAGTADPRAARASAVLTRAIREVQTALTIK